MCPAALLGMLAVSLFGALAGTPACRAQTVVETPQQANDRLQMMSLASQKVQREYVIGNGDVITIDVFDVEELSREVRVSQTGTIALPLLPVRLHVAGLTEIQTEQKIAEVLEANGLVSHPNVSVTVKEKRSKPITVIGAVNHPMVFQADHTVTLLEVLSEAGGITNDAANTVIVTRTAPGMQPGATNDAAPADVSTDAVPAPTAPPISSSSSTPPDAVKPGNAAPAMDEVNQKTAAPVPSVPGARDPGAKDGAAPPPIQITINLSDLLESADPNDNMVLQAGDIVAVPRAGTVYIVGAVQRPGGFVLTNDRSQMTALKLLSLSGGLTKIAKSDSAVIVRKDGTGQQTQIALNLKNIVQRKTEDVPLQPSDVLVIPESHGKQAALRLAEIAIGVGTALAIYRVAIR